MFIILGLIYEIHLDLEAGTCKVVMTFTDTACSCAESLPIEIVARLKEIEGIEDVKVEVTLVTRLENYTNQPDTGASPLVFHHDNNHYHLRNAVNLMKEGLFGNPIHIKNEEHQLYHQSLFLVFL